jgi:hypothetical protein
MDAVGILAAGQPVHELHEVHLQLVDGHHAHVQRADAGCVDDRAARVELEPDGRGRGVPALFGHGRDVRGLEVQARLHGVEQ